MGSTKGGNRRNDRNGETWSLSWDLGFGNWTSTSASSSGGIVGVEILIGLGVLETGLMDSSLVIPQGNVVVQLGASGSGMLIHVVSSH